MRFFLLLPVIVTTWAFAAMADEQAPSVPLKLADYRATVVSANQKLAAGRLDEEISKVQARGERSLYEPALVGNAAHTRTERLNTVEQELSQNTDEFLQDGNAYSAGLEGQSPIGTKYWVGSSLEDTSNNLTSQWTRTPYTEQFVTFSGVRVSQPLLKDAGLGAAMARIRLADGEVRVKHQEQRKKTMDIVSRAELAYWNLALSRYLLDLRLDSVRIAEQVLRDNQERVKAGKMAENEVFEAEAGLARRQAQANDAAQTLVAIRNMVRSFMSSTPSDAETVNLVAVDEPAMETLNADYVTGMRRALRRHPDYLALQEVVKQEGVRIAYNRSQRWPQLDLLASYGLNGIGETAGEAYDQGMEGDYQPWSVGVELRIPLGGGVKERAELATARMRQKQALLEVKTAEIEIGNALDTAMRRVNSTHEQAVHTKAAAEANARLLESEMSRLDAGKSDSRRVLQIEQEWVDARIANYQGLVEHRRAWLDLEVAQGIILDTRGLETAEAK